MEERPRIDISAPDIVNICVDTVENREKKGRMYHIYQKEAIPFDNEHQLLKMMEELMDRLDYPQTSVKARSFSHDVKVHEKLQPQRTAYREQIVEPKGKLGTFIVHVQYRQNATWQGKTIHVESGETQEFFSEIELLKIFDNAV